MTYTIDRPRLVQTIRLFTRDHPGAQGAVRALASLTGRAPAQRTVDRLIEQLLLRAAGVHAERITASRNRMERALNTVLDQLDSLQSEGTRPAPDPAVHARELRALSDALDGLQTFRDDLLFVLKSEEHDWQTMVRNELEALGGQRRSYAPVGAEAWPRPSCPARPQEPPPRSRPPQDGCSRRSRPPRRPRSGRNASAGGPRPRTSRSPAGSTGASRAR